jgi:hypothetical protein
MKATGLDEKLKNADWARAFRDLKDEAQATLRVLEQVADWGWEKILKLTEAIDQKLESWAGKIRAAASALLDMIPGGERLKNMLDLNTNRPAPSGGAAAGAAPDANTSTAEMIIKGAMGLFAPKFTLLVEALRMLNDTVIADGASRRTSEQLLNDERAKSNAGRVELSSSRTPTIDTGSLARQIAMQLPANATAGSAKSVVENGVSIRQVTADMNQQALMEKIASMAGNISAIAMNTSSGAASQRTAPQAIMVPAPRQTQAVSAVDNGRATFAQLQELISQQANAAKPQPFPDRIKADTSDLAQVIREVAAQVANQVAMGQQSSKQLMPAGGYDSGMPWSPKVTSGSQEA